MEDKIANANNDIISVLKNLGWSVVGELPLKQPDFTDIESFNETSDWLNEDVIQLAPLIGGKHPTDLRGIWCIDVGWYPSHSIVGMFHCVLINDQDWEHPIMEHKTIMLTEVLAFIRKAATHVYLDRSNDHLRLK